MVYLYKKIHILLYLIRLGACCNLESLIKVPFDIINMSNKESINTNLDHNESFPLTQFQPRHESYP